MICVGSIWRAAAGVDNGVPIYAHSWSERSEWICPVWSKHDKIECDQKREHILQYNRVGINRVLDGRTVAEFLDNLL